MEYVVYVLFSERFNKHYVGYTSDLISRFYSHNKFARKGYTIRYRPWRVIHVEFFKSKRAAIKRERFLKSGMGRSFIKTITH